MSDRHRDFPNALDLHPTAFVAPGAIVVGEVKLGARSSVWFNTVARGDSERIEIGDDTNIQDNSVVHVDEGMPAIVGNRVTVGHRAIVHGCVIEDDVLAIARQDQGHRLALLHEAGADGVEAGAPRVGEGGRRVLAGCKDLQRAVRGGKERDLAAEVVGEDVGRAGPEAADGLVGVVGAGLPLGGDREEEARIEAAPLGDRRDPARGPRDRAPSGSRARPRCSPRSPGSRGSRVGFFMYPEAENDKGRFNPLDPDAFKYTITARELAT